MAPQERLPIKTMGLKETASFHWRAHGFRDFTQMHKYIGNRLHYLKKYSKRRYSMVSIGGEITVKRHE